MDRSANSSRIHSGMCGGPWAMSWVGGERCRLKERGLKTFKRTALLQLTDNTTRVAVPSHEPPVPKLINMP
jgi:hypothetical protein